MAKPTMSTGDALDILEGPPKSSATEKGANPFAKKPAAKSSGSEIMCDKTDCTYNEDGMHSGPEITISGGASPVCETFEAGEGAAEGEADSTKSPFGDEESESDYE